MQKVGILLLMSALLVSFVVDNANGHSDNRIESHRQQGQHYRHHQHTHQLHQRQRSRKLCTACEPTTFFRFQQRPNGNNSVIVNKINGSSVNDASNANGLIKISAGMDANRYAITEVTQSACVIHVAKVLSYKII